MLPASCPDRVAGERRIGAAGIGLHSFSPKPTRTGHLVPLTAPLRQVWKDTSSAQGSEHSQGLYSYDKSKDHITVNMHGSHCCRVYGIIT